MVLPYLKGLTNKEKHFHVILLGRSCYFWVYFLYNILQVRSTTSGIKTLSWAKWRDIFIFYFYRNFLERRVCKSDLKLLVQNLRNQIVDLHSL